MNPVSAPPPLPLLPPPVGVSIECYCVKCAAPITDATVRKRRLCLSCRQVAHLTQQKNQAQTRKSLIVDTSLPYLSLEETAEVLHMTTEGVRVAERSALLKLRRNFPELKNWLMELFRPTEECSAGVAKRPAHVSNAT